MFGVKVAIGSQDTPLTQNLLLDRGQNPKP